MRLKKASILWKTLAITTAALFVLTIFIADALRVKNTLAASLELPEPTQLLKLTDNYDMPLLKGLHINPADPLKINFILDKGSASDLKPEQLRLLLNYFFAAITVPQKDLWVNLSPYEEDRIIDDSFAMTDMGKDMLAQDYILKQLASSLTHPETESGKAYWAAADAQELSSFNKVWITPGDVEVFEHKSTAYINKAQFLLQTETDYLANKKNHVNSDAKSSLKTILPELSNEVNEGKHFAPLRQIYHSIILGLWFKERFKGTFYSAYIDKAKLEGIEIQDKQSKDKLYELYVDAFKKGVYDFVKTDESSKLRKRYFSGGISSSIIDINDKLQFIDFAAMTDVIAKNDFSAFLEIQIVKPANVVKKAGNKDSYQIDLSQVDNVSLFENIVQTADHILSDLIEDGPTGYLYSAYHYAMMEVLKNAVAYGDRQSKIDLHFDKETLSFHVENRVAKDSGKGFTKAQLMQYNLSGKGIAIESIGKIYGLNYSRERHGDIVKVKVSLGKSSMVSHSDANSMIEESMQDFIKQETTNFYDKLAQGLFKDYLAYDLSDLNTMQRYRAHQIKVPLSFKTRLRLKTNKWLDSKLVKLSSDPSSISPVDRALIKRLVGDDSYNRIKNYANEEATQSSSINLDSIKKSVSIALLTTALMVSTVFGTDLNKELNLNIAKQSYSVVYDNMNTISVAEDLMYDMTLSEELGASVTIDQVLKSIDYTKQYSEQIGKAIDLMIEHGMASSAKKVPVIFLRGLENPSFAMYINGTVVIPGNIIDNKPENVDMVDWLAAGLAHEISHDDDIKKKQSPLGSEKDGFSWTAWGAALIEGKSSMAAQIQYNVADGIGQLIEDSIQVKEYFGIDNFSTLYYSGIKIKGDNIVYSLYEQYQGGDTLEIAYEAESKTISLYNSEVENKSYTQELVNEIVQMPKAELNEIVGTSLKENERVNFFILQEQESGTLVVKFADNDKVFLVSLNNNGELNFVEAKKKQSSAVGEIDQMGGIDLSDVKIKTEQELYIQENIITPPAFHFQKGLAYDVVTLNDDASPQQFIELLN